MGPVGFLEGLEISNTTPKGHGGMLEQWDCGGRERKCQGIKKK